ncbi:heat shock 70 kDa protein 12B-like [Saccostrea echinata]|uniref:heat shock 70 kDa protein 12B-like n=1 Tax=Saccostrea echinata TaxID=191078 RepID=UPI002A820AD4|nr:heat shock 70 kDa protein 12B-like [Saccostrea echinata]
MAEKDYLAVVAIDIGSAFSGYAYQFRTDFRKDPTKNIISPHWQGTSNLTMGKTASSLLLTPDKTFHSFGFEAEKNYTRMFKDYMERKISNQSFTENKSPTDYYFFRNFKMKLYNKEVLRKNMKISDENGKQLMLRTVFKEAIGFLRRHALGAIEKQTTVKDEDIFWVLTVPAIWSEPAKQLMRAAALEAGIPGESLTLALEPEAAALYTKEQALIRHSSDGKIDLVPFIPNSTFMIVDLGGGTGDITVHEVQSDHSLHEKNMATGGAWGGSRVNEAFLQIWKDILKSDYTKCKENYPDEILEFEQSFELLKRQVGEESTADTLYISIPECIRDIPNLNNKIEENEEFPGIKISRGKAGFPKAMLENLFIEPINDITRQLHHLMEKNSVDAIIMVGGFSESKIVYNSLKKTFAKVRILNPPESSLSVLKGAVLYGFHPEHISQRISRYSYGFSISVPFDPLKHNKERDKIHKHNNQLEDVFHPIILAGEKVVPNAVREYNCRPAKVDPGYAQVEFYGTQDNNPRYVKEPVMYAPEFPCKHIGDIMIDYSKQGKPDNNEIQVRVAFGYTQLNVTAECMVQKERRTVDAHFGLLK